MALFSGMILLPIYVQTIRGISPMDAGSITFARSLIDGDHVSINREII